MSVRMNVTGGGGRGRDGTVYELEGVKSIFQEISAQGHNGRLT